MKILLALATALALVACASTPQRAPAASRVQWVLVGTHNYEPEHPGAGMSKRYESAIGWIDTFLYSAGRSDWTNGVSDPHFGENFQEVTFEIVQATRLGYYQNLQLDRPEDLVISGLPFRHLVAHMDFRGKKLESHVYLTARDGYLLKYRMSFVIPVRENLSRVTTDFIEHELDEYQKRR